MKTPDYSKYIKNSFELAKNNRWLWVFALLVGSGGGASFSSISDLLKDKASESPTPEIIKDIPNTTAAVLGDSTTALTEWVRQVPASKWIFLGILATILVLFGAFIALVVTNWARGSLIKGVETARKNERATLRSLSHEGFKYLKSLICFSLLVIGTTIALSTGLPLVWTILYFIFSKIMLLKVLWIIVGVILTPVIIFAFLILLTLVVAYGERLIVLTDMKPKDAIKKAVALSRVSIFPGFLMGIVHAVIGSLIGIGQLVILAIALGVPGYFMFKLYTQSAGFTVILAILMAVSLLIYIFFSYVVRGAFNTFKYSNWNQLFFDALEHIKEDKND